MSVYPGTQVSAFDSSTQQWRPAVVLTVDPLAECAEPCDSTTFLVCFLDTANQEQLHGTTCIRYAADTEPTVCRCFKKFGCRRPECACYIEHKGNSSFGVRTAITGEQFCHYCAAARAADKKDKKKSMKQQRRQNAAIAEAAAEAARVAAAEAVEVARARAAREALIKQKRIETEVAAKKKVEQEAAAAEETRAAHAFLQRKGSTPEGWVVAGERFAAGNGAVLKELKRANDASYIEGSCVEFCDHATGLYAAALVVGTDVVQTRASTIRPTLHQVC